MNFIAKKKGTQRDHLEASEWNTAHTTTNQTGTNNRPKTMQRNPTKEAYSTYLLFFEEALLLCEYTRNLSWMLMSILAFRSSWCMHDRLRNLLHINGQVLNSVGACIWLIIHVRATLDEGPRPKSAKSKLNLHGTILEGKSIGLNPKKRKESSSFA